jgi:hypothetical protein
MPGEEIWQARYIENDSEAIKLGSQLTTQQERDALIKAQSFLLT